ncbi:MAG TPA: antibiotic biosynthesis monooxygenase [Actinomycetota bacterium]|nr:antibiotic biosynthesis monooxygenase [Actinomycetota bacterium]
MVLVQFRVTVPDVVRFRAAFEKWQDAFEEDGAAHQALYVSESDPKEITMLAEWDSHDAMMASSDERGVAFQADAGTEDLEWETRIWHRLA